MARLNKKKEKNRDKMLLGMLASNQDLTLREAQKASKDRYGKGISFERFKTLKHTVQTAPRESVEDTVKQDLKRGTKPIGADLKAELRQFGEHLAANDVDEAVVKMIDGKPIWRVVRRIAEDIQ